MKKNSSNHLNNPGLLKLDLMLRGIRPDPSFFKEGLLLKSYKLSDHLYGNLNLILPESTYVSVPYQEADTKNSPYQLRFLKGKTYLSSKNQSIEVKLLPHPSFYKDEVAPTVPYSHLLTCHGSFVSLNLGGHRYLQSHLLNSEEQSYRKELIPSPDDLVGILEEVQKEQPIDVIALSSWNIQDEDGGIAQIENYIRRIKSSFNVLVFVEVHLPQNLEWVNKTYAMGADSVCYHIGNLCSHGNSQDEKPRDTSLEIKFLKHAVQSFPRGTILSHITMGDRPFEDVIEDIDSLSQIKVLPILTWIDRQNALENKFKAEDLAALYAHVYEQAKKKKITMNWFAKIAPFMAPIEGRFFSGDSPKLKLALMNLYQSRFMGGSISAGLSNLRRRLRVKEVKK